MNNKQKEERIKQISFISGEDFYFLTYLILICLKEISNKSMLFKDHRKLTFLMQLIASPKAISVLVNNKENHTLHPEDKEILFDIFVKASLNEREVYKILRSLEKNKIIGLINTDKPDCYDIKILNNEILTRSFNTMIFQSEFDNINILKSIFKRINSLTLNTLITKIFENHGLKLWVS